MTDSQTDSRVRGILSLAAILGIAVVLTGCGAATAPPGDSSVAARSVAVSSSPVASSTTVAPARSPSPATAEPAETAVQTTSDAVIVSCQESFGPIETYWSDGSVTAWSEYCQQAQDRVLQAEVDANAGPRASQVAPPAASPSVWNQDTDTWRDQNGDGAMQGYERCGLACGDAPTSGDIQTQDGCEQGYITGEVCNRYR